MQDINPGLQEDTRSHFLNYLQLLWFRRRFVFLVTLIVAVLGAFGLAQESPVYQSSTSLRIGNPDSAATAGVDEIASEIEVLRSRQLAATVVKQFQLQIYPEFNPGEELGMGITGSIRGMLSNWFTTPSKDESVSVHRESEESPLLPRAIDRFLENLQVDRVGESRVARITFVSRDPELAARIANAVPEAYLSARQQASIEASAHAADFAAEQFIQLKEKLAAAERAESYYRNTFGLEESEQIEQFDRELSDLNSQLAIAQARKTEALAQLEIIDTQTVSEAEAISLQEQAAAASEEVIGLEARLAERVQEASTLNRRLSQLKRLEEEALVSRVQFDAAVERLKQNSAGGLLVTPDSEILSGATASREPLYPGRAGRMVNIVLAGFGLALLLVLVRQMRNPGLLSPEHVHFLLGESTIGVIPAVPDHVKPHELVLDDPDSSFAEAVGALKITLDLADLDHPAKVIQLASSLPGEGRAVLAVALARAEAKAGRKVLLVSAHLRSSTIEKKLGVNDRVPGLTDLLLSEESTLVDVVIGDDRSGVDFLSAGTAEYANADVVFSSQRMQSLVEEMRSTYDFVIFDTPPLVSTADAIAVGRLVDKTLFVARWNKTPKRVVAASLRKLRSGGLDIAGVVLQHVNLRRYGSIGFSDFGYLYHQKK